MKRDIFREREAGKALSSEQFSLKAKSDHGKMSHAENSNDTMDTGARPSFVTRAQHVPQINMYKPIKKYNFTVTVFVDVLFK